MKETARRLVRFQSACLESECVSDFFESCGELVERGLAGEDGFDESEEISCCRKLDGLTLDEFCFSCSFVEAVEK